MYYLGVDTGGTFTDFVLYDRTGTSIATFKERSTPNDPGLALERGLLRLRDQYAAAPTAIGRFIFGTTVATNAVLEHRGGPSALITTEGFRDVLEIQRQWRNRLFDLYLEKPRPLVPGRHRLEVAERVTAQGEVLVPLSDAAIERCLERLAALPVESVAISLLFSFLNPSHERRLAAAVRRRLPALHVTASIDVCPEFREYERTATTVMNAYTMPKVAWLVDRLDAALERFAIPGKFSIIQSNGGVVSPQKARSHPVNTLLSGPAAGVVGATAMAASSGIDNAIAFALDTRLGPLELWSAWAPPAASHAYNHRVAVNFGYRF